jgi:hypothetical protein
VSDEPDELDECAYLWDGSEPGWVVLERPEGFGIPFNTRTRMVLLIDEDDDLARRVCQRMKDEGCDILKELPPIP